MKEHRIVFGFALLVLALCYVGIAFGQQPACPWPDVKIPAHATIQPLPKGFREQKVLIWTCATPTGYRNATFVFKDSEVAAWLPSLLTADFDRAAADAACAKSCDLIFEDNLVAAIHKIAEPYKARAFVKANGKATSRPVYPVTADGTPGPDPIPNARVAVGAKCWINAGNRKTEYYRVDLELNVATADPSDVLPKSFAQCSVSLPLGSNGE